MQPTTTEPPSNPGAPPPDTASDASITHEVQLHALAGLAEPVSGWRGRVAQATGGVLGLTRGRGTRERWVGAAVLMAGLVALFVVLRAGGDDRASVSLPMATRRTPGSGSASASPGTPAPPTTTAAAPSTSQPATWWVAITGAVHRPGVYLLPPGTRMSQLVASAGGTTPEADPDRINLASPIRDGERVYIPRRGEAAAPGVIAGDSGPAPPSMATPPPSDAGVPTTSAGPLNVNTATAAQLDTLPGVGPSTAKAIIEHRQVNGPFSAVDELARVRGIGPAKLEQLRPLVTV